MIEDALIVKFRALISKQRKKGPYRAVWPVGPERATEQIPAKAGAEW